MKELASNLVSWRRTSTLEYKSKEVENWSFSHPHLFLILIILSSSFFHPHHFMNGRKEEKEGLMWTVTSLAWNWKLHSLQHKHLTLLSFPLLKLERVQKEEKKERERERRETGERRRDSGESGSFRQVTTGTNFLESSFEGRNFFPLFFLSFFLSFFSFFLSFCLSFFLSCFQASCGRSRGENLC